MKLNHATDIIERGGIQAESIFKIKTTAKAFDILSSGLYTDNILAIVRELSANAYDAHVSAKRADVPFEIHLPNSLEPFFSVKDNGTGLDDHQVMGLYTTYFDSTKTDSNDFIGALGLGSKSPFSYTNAFEVISRFNGIKRTYSIFLNGDRIPSVAKHGELSTDDPNGLEVRIAVHSKDFDSFAARTAHILKYFPTKPTITGKSHFAFETLPAKRIVGNDWQLFQQGDQFVAVQGHIPYYVNIEMLKSELTEHEMKMFEHVSAVAFFNIGELEVAASREEIRYDERSKKALVDKIKKIRSEIVPILEKELTPFKDNPWYGYIHLHEYAISVFRNNARYGGMFDYRNIVAEHNIKNIIFRDYIKNRGVMLVGPLTVLNIAVYEQPEERHFKARKQTRLLSCKERYSKEDGITKFIPEGNTCILFNDLLSSGAITRTHEWMQKNSYKRAIIVAPAKGIVSTGKEQQEAYEKIVSQLGNPKSFYLSKVTTPKQKIKKDIVAFRYYRRPGDSNIQWNPVDKLQIETLVQADPFHILYVPLKHRTIVQSFDENAPFLKWTKDNIPSNLHSMVALLNTHYKPTVPCRSENIIGIPSFTWNKIKGDKRWVNVFDLVTNTLPRYCDDLSAFARFTATQNTLDIKTLLTENWVKQKRLTFIEHVNKLSKDSKFRELVTPLIDGSERFQDSKPMLTFIRSELLENGVTIPNFTVDYTPFYKDDAFDVYPMLTFVKSIKLDSAKAFQILFDYIASVDKTLA